MSICEMSKMQYCYKDIIPVFLEDFKKDFDCKDIEDGLRAILKKEEVDNIVNEPYPLQTYRLFWTLRDQQNDVVKRFVEEVLKDSHGPNYGFLLSAIQKECKDPSLNTKNYISKVDRLYNDNQKFTKYNVSRIEQYMELQKALLELRPSKNVLVEGDLGAGKQWLALDVCSSYIVQQKMDFNIFWLDVRKCCSPKSRLEALQSFLYIIDQNQQANCDGSIQLRTEWLKSQLRDKLKSKLYKNCLLVLRNVQNRETWEAFNLGCKILLTTRHKNVVNFLSTLTTTHVTLKDALSPFEIECLFSKFIPEITYESLKKLTVTLIHYKKTNPLLLTTIAKSIRDGHCTIDNWEQRNSEKLTSIIETTLNVLNPDERQLYKNLFIFRDSAYIPLHLLSIVWSINDPITIVNKFYKYSLIKKHLDNKKRMTITLPSIYFELNIHIVNEAVLHRKIIEYYNVSQVFDETNGLLLPNLDNYFYKHIGYHISKLNDNIERETLFRKVYLDFRFLDQKIRHDCTPLDARGYVLPTLQDLRLYEVQRINEKQYMCAHQTSDYKDNDNVIYYDFFVNELITFLRNSEEKLIRSEFSCLLQIALMTEVGVVYDEAFRQAQRLPSYVWFTECGQFNQHREIINLGKHQVRHAIYLDDDYCLMALSNQQLLLTDVSLDGDMTYLLSDDNDVYDIVDMRVFNKHKHLLTLYSNGSLKLLSLQHLLRRHNTDSPARPRLGQAVKHSKIFCNMKFVNNDVQRLTNTSADQQICSFFLEEKDDEHDNIFIQLHLAFNNGDICICDWEIKEEKFKQSHTPILKTHQRKLRCFAKVMDRFYVLCTVDCTLTVWDLRRGSKETEHKFENEEALTMETYIDKNGDYTMLLLILKSRVWQLRFKHSDNICTIDKKPLLFTDMEAVSITCGKLSKDGRYLVLGTVQGLIVYDLKLFDSVLRRNISEHIICIDIYDLNSPTLKYIILCGAAGKSILHLHTLRNIPANENQSISWTHKAKSECGYSNITTFDLQSYIEPNVYLRPLLIKCNNDTLLAVDSKSRIHKIQIKDDESHWSMITTPQMDRNSHITALCICKNNDIIAGCSNGVIFNISKNKRLLQEYSTDQVDYLNMINSTILITSSKTSSKYATSIFNLSKLEMNTASLSIWPIKLSKYTMSARLLNEHFLLIFTENGVIYIDLYSPQQRHDFAGSYDRLVGFDMKEHRLYLAFINRTVKLIVQAKS
ncbi:uncharacterized protein LOC108653831 isoform X2 [Drosophila navojoa]|uniref:uncharacterized protein LOC108653831 isoform X2 n=1 Tax=Drosophila navojoa TaxID=7232 RepID=UPI0011BE8003|nr:uncharacterized protein LOC108653831 isoform X2 [Drosophila navojoa]